MPVCPSAPLAYRSMGINGWQPLDLELVQLAAELGFNDLQITFAGSAYDLYFDFRGRANESGLFDVIQQFGMTTTLWVREFYHQNYRWGLPQVDNDAYWEGLRRRYAGLAALYPEIDYLILTLVESDKWVVAYDVPVIAKTANTIHQAVRAAGKQLILRTFTWHRELALKVGEALHDIPDEVLVSTKCVGNDWNYRQSHHPLIGRVGNHKQIVEMNLFGTWQREHYVANAYTDEIARRFEYWVQQGVCGIFVPPDGRTLQSRPVGNAQEMNLWAIGRLAMGERDLDAAWLEYATRRYGERAAETMVKALRPTGQVVDEALHVGREFYGHPGGGIPAVRMMVSGKAEVVADEQAEWVPGELEKFDLQANPYAINFSTWRWDPEYIPEYHRIRKGHPAVIAEKVARYEEQRASARRSLDLLETVADDLSPNAYAFTRFKLEENAYLLEVMTEMELAWLKASSALYYCGTESERQAFRGEVEEHLARLERLAEDCDESLQVEWQGIEHDVRRGEYLNILGYVDEFRLHWGFDTGERHLPRTEEEVEIPYGTVRIVRIGESYYLDWGPIAKRWDISDRDVIWMVRRAMTPADQPTYIRG
jgi:hypothetical protein